MDKQVPPSSREMGASWILGYVSAQFAGEAFRTARDASAERIAASLEKLSVTTPAGKVAMNRDARHAPMGIFFGRATTKPEYAMPVIGSAGFVQP